MKAEMAVSLSRGRGFLCCVRRSLWGKANPVFLSHNCLYRQLQTYLLGMERFLSICCSDPGSIPSTHVEALSIYNSKFQEIC